MKLFLLNYATMFLETLNLLKPGAQQCLVFGPWPTPTHEAGDCRSSRTSRFVVSGASSTCSVGIAAALASELQSPRRTAPKVKRDFIIVCPFGKITVGSVKL